MLFGKKYPENIILIRYEDLCLDPYGTVEKLRIFLDYGYLKDPINNAIKSLYPCSTFVKQTFSNHNSNTNKGM